MYFYACLALIFHKSLIFLAKIAAKNRTLLISLCAIMMLAASVLSGCDGGEEYNAKYSYVSVPGRIEIVASADEQSRWMDGYETHSERADYCFQTSGKYR